jgi:hypothetical protein
MKKPTLRLRQVFEGPTHFKVVKPLGNPIKIAKKGLSPNLMGRLRKFARAGEVTDADTRDIDLDSEIPVPIEAPPRAPTLAEIMARPEFIPGEEPVGAPVEVVKERDVAQTPIEALPVVAPERVTAEPRVQRASRVVGASEAMRMGPPAPVAPAAPVMNLDQINAMIGEEISKPEPDMSRLAQLDAQREALQSAATPAPAAPAPAPVPAAPMAAAPAAVAAPSVSGVRGVVTGRPRPQRPAVVSVVEQEAPVEQPAALTAAAAPVAEPAPEAAAPVEPTPFERGLGLVKVSLDQYNAAPEALKLIIRQAARTAFAAEAAKEADLKAADAEFAALEDERKAQESEVNRLKVSLDEARTTQKNILEEYDYIKNPTSYFGSLSTLGQIGTAISLAAGAFASGMTGMPNFAQKIYDNAIEQDLQAQKRRADSLYQRLVAAGNSVSNAEDMVRAQLNLVGAAEKARKAMQIKLPQVKAKIEAEAAKSAQDATLTMQRIAKDQAAMARAAQKEPLETAKLLSDLETAKSYRQKIASDIAARNREFKQRQDELEIKRQEAAKAAQDKADSDRIERGLTVGDSELELKNKTGSKDVRDNIAAREQAMMSILKLESLFKKEGLSIYNPLSESRIEALEELATFIEQYPKAAGFKRAISLSAAKQLKEGLQSPAGGFALVKKLLGADPAVAITGIRREVQRSYADQVRSVVRNPQSDEVNNAILSAYEKANKEIKRFEAMQTPSEDLFTEE